MIKIISYEKNIEGFNQDFINNIDLDTVVICPSPSLADLYRQNSSKNSDIKITNVQVVTISSFITGLLKIFSSSDYKTKSELMLELAALWKIKFSSDNYKRFIQIYNLFTELRSYTLNENLIDEILNDFSDEVANPIRLFWIYLENAKVIDEHQSYSVVTNELRNENSEVIKHLNDELIPKNYIFWGFRHMTGVQVDFLKSLSITNKIYILQPSLVLSSLLMSDWVSWLTSTPEAEFSEVNYSCDVIYYGKNKLSNSLKPFLANNKDANIYLFSGNITPSFINEVPHDNLEYKVAVDIFLDLFKKEVSNLKKEIGKGKKDSKLLMELIDTNISNCVEENSFRKLKALLVIKETLISWINLTEFNENISSNDLTLIEEVGALNLPRNFFTSGFNNTKGFIADISTLNKVSKDKEVCICFSSKYGTVVGENKILTSKQKKILSNIGPTKRKELDLEYIKHDFYSLLSDIKVTLFLERKMEESDLYIEYLLSNVSPNIRVIENKTNKKTKVRKKIDSWIMGDQKAITFSATKMQDYLDCPRKFYLKHIQKLSFISETSISMRPNELGTIEHEIIQRYIENYNHYDIKKHEDIVWEIFEEKTLDKNISNALSGRYLNEFITLSERGINAVLSIISMLPGCIYEFEKDLSKVDSNVSGRADFVVEYQNQLGIIDFKRSQSSIPKAKELKAFKKSQMWFYLSRLVANNNKTLFWGYLNLSDLKSSIFWVDELFKQDFKLGKQFNLDSRLELELDKYKIFEKKVYNNIINDNCFLPRPESSGVCKYCPIKSMCDKGEAL